MAKLPVFHEQTLEDENTSPCADCPQKKEWGKTSGCVLAPLKRYTLIEPQPASPNEPIDVLIVGDSPSDADGDDFFSDATGKEVMRALRKSGVRTFAVLPAVRCGVGDVDYNVVKKKYKGKGQQQNSRYVPKKTSLEKATEAVEHCKEYVKRAQVSYAPAITVAMGALATSALGYGPNVANLRTIPFRPKPGLKRVKKAEGTLITYDRYASVTNASNLRSLTKDLKRLSYLRKNGALSPRGDKSTIKHVILDTVDKVRKFVEFATTNVWEDKVFLAMDYETKNTDLSTQTNQILNVGFAFTCDEDLAYEIPLWHPETPFTADELQEIIVLLRHLYEAKETTLSGFIAHSAQFEQHMSKLFFNTYIGHKKCPMLDSEIAAFLMDENRKGPISRPYALETLCGDLLGFNWYGLSGIKQKRDRLINEPIDVVNEYVGIDAVMTVRLMLEIIDLLIEEGSFEDMWKLMTCLYSEGIEYTADMQLTGQIQNIALLRALRHPESVVQQRIIEVTKEFENSPEVARAVEILSSGGTVKGAAATGMKRMFKGNTKVPFNMNSGAHLKVLFDEVMELDGADESVDANWQKLHDDVPLVLLFQEYQKLTKLDRSYLQPIANWLQHANSVDGRLHPRFKLTSTVTGRLACADPNTQNVPTRGSIAVAKQIKALTEADVGNVLVQLDFSQAEVRWLGIMAADENLKEKYETAERLKQELKKDPDNKELQRRFKIEGDLHRSTAIGMYKLDLSLLDTNPSLVEEKRQAAKSICFGLIYGKSAASLAADLKVPVEQMEKDIDLWLSQFPQARAFLDQLEVDAATGGYVRSPFGRYRRLPGARSSNTGTANRAKRQARNTPIQSAASDCCLYAAAKLRRLLQVHPDPRMRAIKLVNTVHDSVVAEVMEDREVIRMYCELAQSVFCDVNLLMEDFGVFISVPLAVDFELGANWANMRGYDFSDESMDEALHDAAVIRTLPAGSLFKDKDLVGKFFKEKNCLALREQQLPRCGGCAICAKEKKAEKEAAEAAAKKEAA